MTASSLLRRCTGFVLSTSGAFAGGGAAWALFEPMMSSISGVFTSSTGWFGVSSIPVLVAVTSVGAIALRVGLKLLNPTAQELLNADKRSLIVFLRSFGDDNLPFQSGRDGPSDLIARITMSGATNTTLEEVLATTLSPIGPVVAVNRPGCKLAPLGAARQELPDDLWKEHVADWIDRAHLIVLMVGRTGGLLWEVETVFRQRAFSRLLLVFPPVISDQEHSERWKAMLSLLKSLVEEVPEVLPRDTAFVRFSENGQLIPVAAKVEDAREMRAALAQVMPELGRVRNPETRAAMIAIVTITVFLLGWIVMMRIVGAL